MFFLTYLRSELRRRLGRTILTVLGLAVGVGLVVATSALGAGVDRAQQKVLGPLAGVATDVTVTKRAVPFAEGGPVALAGGSLETNLSKLGEPGEAFETDTFFSTQGNITDADANSVARTDGVASTAKALLLQGIHQTGTIPKTTTTVQTGGETIEQDQAIEPMNEQEQEAFQACLDENGAGQNGGGGVRQAPGGPGGGPDPARREAFNTCLPERFRNVRAAIRIPRRDVIASVDTPDTDIRSRSFTIAGIEPQADINLISREQVTAGRFLSAPGEAMVSNAYADEHKLDIGSKLKLKTTTFTVVGLVTAPLGGNAADVYLTLTDLQTLSDRVGQSNILLARTSDAAKVATVSKNIESDIAGTNVADASELADQVAGSLVDSANLIRRLGLVLAIVGLVAAVLIAALLTLSSVAKRTRELGTLKAIGWRPKLVVRQILAESAIQGVLGGIVGVGLGIGAASLLGIFAPSLDARAVGGGGPGGGFGFGRFGDTAQQAAETVRLTAPVSPWILLLAAGLAVAGGVVAGAIGASRAARLRPADAMREVG